MSRKPNVYSYIDFREYLSDLYKYKNKRNKNFSKTYICKELGLKNSRSYFQDVLNGKFVSQIKLPLLIRIFKLSKDEAIFFRLLVNYNQTLDDPEEREFFFEQLISLNKTPKVILDSVTYSYYKDWYNSIVRAVLNIVDFKQGGDYLQLARQIFPPITELQAKKSIQLLLKLNLIKINKKGFLKPTNQVISTGAYAKAEIIKQYQLKSIKIAQDAIIKNTNQSQRIITKTMTVSSEGFNNVLKNIEKCNSEINSIVHKDDKKADKIYQLNIVLFPHLKRGSK